LSMLAGAAIGVVAVQGLQAQGKPKAYTVSELESLDPTAQAAFTPLAQAAMKAAGGRTLNTGGGRVVGIDGPPPPSGTASIRRRHITNRRLGLTLRHNVTKQSRQYGGTPSNR
jgi:hypothetical protein